MLSSSSEERSGGDSEAGWSRVAGGVSVVDGAGAEYETAGIGVKDSS